MSEPGSLEAWIDKRLSDTEGQVFPLLGSDCDPIGLLGFTQELEVVWPPVDGHMTYCEAKLSSGVLDQIERLLAKPLTQLLVARMAVLDLLYSAWDFSPTPDCRGLADDDRSQLRTLFKRAIAAVPVADLPDSRWVRWELVPALLTRDRGRTEELLERLRSEAGLTEPAWLVQKAELSLLRFLTEHGGSSARRPRGVDQSPTSTPIAQESWPSDELFGSPILWDTTSEFSGLIRRTLIGGWAVRIERPVLPAHQLAQLLGASADVQAAVRHGPEVKALYSAALAKCNWLLGNLADAATGFADALNADSQHECFAGVLGLSETYEGGEPPAGVGKRALYQALAAVQKEAGRLADAVSTMSTCAAEFPLARGISSTLAGLVKDTGDYRAAYEHLREEVNRNPALESDLATGLALALGGALAISEESDRRLRAAFSARDGENRVLASAVRSNWPTFAKLSADAQANWVYGAWLCWDPRVAAPQAFRLAVVTFAGVLESELQVVVFGPFAESVRLSKDKTAQAERDCGRKPRLSRLAAFCLRRGRPLTLGEMFTTLESHHARGTSESDLTQWVESQLVALSPSRVGLLSTGAIASLRNRAVHPQEGISPADAERCHDLCRLFLAALHSGPL